LQINGKIAGEKVTYIPEIERKRGDGRGKGACYLIG